jgi:1-pyrroline-5-carboxylate dehydrogenase
MLSAIPRVPYPQNEPTLSYAPGTPERQSLKQTLERMQKSQGEIPLYIGGREVRTQHCVELRSPHAHRAALGQFCQAGRGEVEQAIAAARAAAPGWAGTPWYSRLAVFLRAAELLTTRYRQLINAATMIGQSKTVHQAEIDAACESIDFWRWNAHFAQRIYEEQPAPSPGTWNILDARPLEGFVLAVTPFNFTSIGANLPVAPAMLGNVVLWKPASTAVLSSHVIMQVLREAGLPDGVINFIPAPPQVISETALVHPQLAAIHFTGSTGVFQTMWQTVGQNIARYRTYPRLVGETGGKDFILAHASADVDALAVAIVRGGFEYQGQKCSAASRIYVPQSLWRGGLRDRVAGLTAELRMGDVSDFRNFVGAVIDKKSFDNIGGYVAAAKAGPGMRVLTGGELKGEEGWFVTPTVVESEDPKSRLMQEEIFGPVVTVHPYADSGADHGFADALKLVDETSPYGLTGAVFARDRAVIAQAAEGLRHAAGNFYINDKPTGAVVGQQPFGGARASGTNDKAGSLWNLTRWISPRTIKENFAPPVDYRYPYMGEA